MNNNSSVKFLRLTLFSLFLLGINNLIIAQPEPISDNGYKLTINNFEILTSNKHLELLRFKVPEAFAVKYIINENINYIDNEDVIFSAAQIAGRNTDISFVDKNIYLDRDNYIIRKALDTLQIDYILSGSLTDYKGQFRIDIELYNVKKETAILNYYLGFKQDSELFGMIDTIAAITIRRIISESTPTRKVAIISFDYKTPECNKKVWYGKSVSQTIYNSWDNEEFEILPWWKTENYSIDDPKDLKDMTDHGIDLLFHGKIFCYENEIIVMPGIYLTEAGKNIDLNPIHGASESVVNVKRTLVSDLNDISANLIDNSGKWSYNKYFEAISNDTSLSSLVGLSKYYSEQKDYVFSNYLLEKAINRHPQDFEALYYLAENKRLEGKDLIAAESQFRDLIADHDTALLPRYSLGRLYLEKREYSSALREFYKIEEYNQDYLDIQLQIGKTFFAIGDSANVNASFERFTMARLGDPDNVEAYLMLGRWHEFYRENEKAKEMYTKAQSLDDEDLEVRWALRGINIKLGREAYFQGTLLTNNVDLELIAANKLSVAENNFLDAAKIAPDAEIYEFLRLIYLRNADYRKARKIIKEGVDEKYFDYFIYYKHAELLRWVKDADGNFTKISLNQAIDFYEEYYKYYPFDDIVQRRIGSSYFRMREYEKAERSYKKAKDLDPMRLENYMNLVEVQLMVGSYEDAISNLDKLKQLGFKGRYAKSDELITEYLHIVADLLNTNSITQWREEYYNDYEDFIKEFGNVKLSEIEWNFKTFENWLNSENKYTREIDTEVKEKILELTLIFDS